MRGHQGGPLLGRARGLHLLVQRLHALHLGIHRLRRGAGGHVAVMRRVPFTPAAGPRGTTGKNGSGQDGQNELHGGSPWREDTAVGMGRACRATGARRQAMVSPRSRKALTITLTDDSAIAAAATAGDSSSPNTGYSTPAATGMPATL